MKAEFVFNPNVSLDYDFLFIFVEGREKSIKLSYDNNVMKIVTKEFRSKSSIKRTDLNTWTGIPIELNSISNEDILNAIPSEIFL